MTDFFSPGSQFRPLGCVEFEIIAIEKYINIL